MTKSSRANGIYGIYELAKLLGLPEYDDEHVYEASAEVYVAAIKAGESEEQAEIAALDAEAEEEKEAYDHWFDALMFVAEELCREHKLTLVELRNGRWRLKPSESWHATADEIRTTINGMGPFHFSSLKEFIETSSCSTAREAVFSHLHWLKCWYAVYEGSSARAAFERRMRSS